MKKLFFLVMVVMLAGSQLLNGQRPGQGMGQGMGQDDNEKLTAYKIAFFTQRLDLTPAEAEKFWPLYNDFSARKNKIQFERVSLLHYSVQNEANMSEAEITSTADKLARTFSDEAELIVSFNESVKKVLPPAKVIRLYHIENQYKQQLLRELNQRRQGQSTGPGIRGRSGQVVNPDM